MSNEYVNSSSKLKWECSKGHQWEACTNSVKSGSWCPTCSGKTKGTIKQMQELAKERGGECLSIKSVNTLSKLKWKCSKGHIWETAPTNIKTGSWCPECSGKKTITIERLSEFAHSRGGKCLPTFYKNKEKLLWECAKAFRFMVSEVRRCRTRLTPDEYLNGDLKQKIRSGLPARTQKDLEKKTRSFMCTLQNRPWHVRNYFKHPKIAYAA